MHHPPNVALLLAALLLIALPASPPPALADTASDGPATFEGTLRYVENGPGAGTDGIATSLFVGGVGAPVAAGRLQSVFSLLSNTGALGDNPTMASVSELMNSSVPVDLAGLLPVSAHYEARLAFTLEQGQDGAFALRSGEIDWRVSNSAEFSADGHALTDRFSGSGGEPLDPAQDAITLTFDLDADPATYTLTVDVSHELRTSGESTWSAAGGAMVMHLEANDGVHIMDGQAMGQPIPPEVVKSAPDQRGVYYTHTGPLSELRYTETWRNLLDAQVLADYEIVDACRGYIDAPAADDKVTLPACYHCNLELDLQGSTVPEVWVDDVTWKVPEFDGKSPHYDPEDAQGDSVKAWFDGPGPQKNDAFGPLEIELAFDEAASRCEPPDPQRVRVFFGRDSYNNPDGSVPNWFYYWMDTAAAQGHRGKVIYDSACADYGYYNGFADASQADVIYVGRIFGAGNPSANPVTGKVTEGIDLFASTVLHEWTHLETYHSWWGAAGYQMQQDAAGNWGPDPLDRDFDLVPDRREAAYQLSPRTQDTLGLGFRDCEYPAYLQEHTWPNGSLDEIDWADPGKQSGS
ncbi:MAG: hypothetical protein GXY68_06485 [Chloroflexi bacterium]|nr:hypothetical protein [Chloroflexota bacterium]